MPLCSELMRGLASTVLVFITDLNNTIIQYQYYSVLIVLFRSVVFILYWNEQMMQNCANFVSNTRPTHAINIQFLMIMARYMVDPH